MEGSFICQLDQNFLNLVKELSIENPQKNVIDQAESTTETITDIDRLSEDVKSLSLVSHDDASKIDGTGSNKHRNRKPGKTTKVTLKGKIDNKLPTLSECDEERDDNKSAAEDKTDNKLPAISQSDVKPSSDVLKVFEFPVDDSTALSDKRSDKPEVKEQVVDEVSDSDDEVDEKTTVLLERQPFRHAWHHNAQYQVYNIPINHVNYNESQLPSNQDSVVPSIDTYPSSFYQLDGSPSSSVINGSSSGYDSAASPSSSTFYPSSPSFPIRNIHDVSDNHYPKSNLSGDIASVLDVPLSYNVMPILNSDIVEEFFNDLSVRDINNLADPSTSVSLLQNTCLPNPLDDFPEPNPVVSNNPNDSQNYSKTVINPSENSQSSSPEINLKYNSHSLNTENVNVRFQQLKFAEAVPFTHSDDSNNFQCARPVDFASQSPTSSTYLSLAKVEEYKKISDEIDNLISQDTANRERNENERSRCGNNFMNDKSPLTNISNINTVSTTGNRSNKCTTRSVACKLGTMARFQLANSPSFSTRRYDLERNKIFREIQNGEYGTTDETVIHYLKVNKKLNYRRSNLHDAVITGNIEKALCLVEIHKKWHKTITGEINLRDTYQKTALDYSKEKGFDLLTEYLIENTATYSANIEPRTTTRTTRSKKKKEPI